MQGGHLHICCGECTPWLVLQVNSHEVLFQLEWASCGNILWNMSPEPYWVSSASDKNFICSLAGLIGTSQQFLFQIVLSQAWMKRLENLVSHQESYTYCPCNDCVHPIKTLWAKPVSVTSTSFPREKPRMGLSNQRTFHGWPPSRTPSSSSAGTYCDSFPPQRCSLFSWTTLRWGNSSFQSDWQPCLLSGWRILTWAEGQSGAST